MGLNTYGLQCLAFGLTGFGTIIIVLVFVIGAARLLSSSIELPEEWSE